MDVLSALRSEDDLRREEGVMSYFPTDIPFMSNEELIENGLKKPYKKPEIINSKDVVPVVRCRDCKHLGTFRGKLYCRHNCGIVEPKENDFCSRGERKE